MIYWELFLAFLLPGILGYGGGPATIPLVEYEVVHRYEWMTSGEFAEMIALGNALPGPIATKMAGFVGFQEAGIMGAVVALGAMVIPSLILMILLISLLMKYKDSPKVKMLSSIVRPTIAVLLGVMTFRFIGDSLDESGWMQTVLIMGVSYVLLEIRKIHPAYVILLALLYGGLFL